MENCIPLHSKQFVDAENVFGSNKELILLVQSNVTYHSNDLCMTRLISNIHFLTHTIILCANTL